MSRLETGQRQFERRGLLDDLAAALGCSVADLTGQLYLLPDRATADALATVPGIQLAIYDCTLHNVPDMPARPVNELVLQGQMYGRASLTCDDASPVFPATRHFSSI